MAKGKGFFGTIFGAIGRLFLYILKTVFKAVLVITIISVIYAVIVGSLYVNSMKIPDDAALRIEISGQIVDQYTYVDPMTALTSSDEPNEYVLRDLINALELASEDERISSAVLVLHEMQNSGVSKIEELGAAIERFKAAGKRVVAVSDAYSQQQYLLASYAHEIILHPMGAVELTGLSGYQLYMADALEKLGINIHVFRTGPYKSAVEPLIATEMGPESREQSQRIIDDIWSSIRTSIVSRREITEEELLDYSTNLDELMLQTQGDLAQLALDYNLVDTISSRDEMIVELQRTAGRDESGDFYNFVNVQPYLNGRAIEKSEEPAGTVGLLIAKGAIYDGVQEAGTIGGDSTAYLLKQSRLNDDLDALVIRVDSPGGSAFASEIIRREVELYKDEDIPIYISMGSVAASGGYWISSPADEIWATQTTITGSIGAFAAIPTFEDSLAKLGLNSDGVRTGPLAGVLAVDRPLSNEAKTIVQSRIDNLYGQFLYQVSTDRDIPLDQLAPIAGGRVWTGQQALDIGLVDQLGDLNDVVEAIADEAGLGSDYRVQVIERELSPAQQALRWFTDQVSISAEFTGLSNILAEFSPKIDEVQSKLELLSDPQNLYLHCGICELAQSD